MKLPFKPHILVLLCSAGLFAASGVMFVKSRATEPAPAPAPVAPQLPDPAAQPAPVATPAYTAAQIDQWTAPIALYPDALLSQILMASTYPASVIQAAQWSKDNPKMQGDAAIQAVSGQPWDASVKSLVAFPQLMSLMGENPSWVQSLGDAFLAQPKDVMDSVQRLRLLAKQTGTLQSTPQQTVTTVKKSAPASASSCPNSIPNTMNSTVVKGAAMNMKPIGGMLLLMVSTFAFAQQSFSTPEQAANALTKAISEQNESAMADLLGDNWRDYLPPEGVDPEAVARFLRDWKINHRTEISGDIAHLSVGDNGWQLPIPVVKKKEGWQFDMQKAADEILTREIGRNELAAIEALHAYVDAQRSYYAMNHRYAQKIVSTPGLKDGLYWPISPGEAPSPLGPAFSPPEPGMGYHGYRFRILSDKNGFAMVAWPVSYGQTGVMSFVVNQEDKVYQANLGNDSAQKAQALAAYHPDKTWQPVTP